MSKSDVWVYQELLRHGPHPYSHSSGNNAPGTHLVSHSPKTDSTVSVVSIGHPQPEVGLPAAIVHVSGCEVSCRGEIDFSGGRGRGIELESLDGIEPCLTVATYDIAQGEILEASG